MKCIHIYIPFPFLLYVCFYSYTSYWLHADCMLTLCCLRLTTLLIKRWKNEWWRHAYAYYRLHIGQVLSEAYETVAREKTAERPELVKLLTTPLEVSGLNGKDLIPPASTSRAYVVLIPNLLAYLPACLLAYPVDRRYFWFYSRNNLFLDSGEGTFHCKTSILMCAMAHFLDHVQVSMIQSLSHTRPRTHVRTFYLHVCIHYDSSLWLITMTHHYTMYVSIHARMYMLSKGMKHTGSDAPPGFRNRLEIYVRLNLSIFRSLREPVLINNSIH